MRVVNILKRRGWREQDFTLFIAKLKKVCQLAPGDPLKERVCRDPDDDWLLACAHESGAEVIVTGDKDVLVLEEYGGIRILDARSFLNQLT